MKKSYLPVANLLLSMIILACPVFAGVLTVNDSSAGIVCNQTLSLKEAAQFASDGSALRNLTDGEKNQISGVTWLAFPPDSNCAGAIWRAAVNGGVGKFVTDSIFFTNGVNQVNDYVLLGRDDRINGLKPNGSKVILDGTGVGDIGGITFTTFNDQLKNTTNSQVSYLVIRNFQSSGISAGFVRGSIFEGLEIYGNGGNGITLLGTVDANPRSIRIGGTQIGQRNHIYSNNLDGISIKASPSSDRVGLQNIVILNNYIGTSNGTTDNGNNGNGVYLEHTFGVTIGDSTGATRNVISGNNNDGIKIVGSQSFANEVIGNFVGTDSSGGTALGNAASGIALLSATGSTVDFITKGPNQIGKPGFGNVISANNYGIFIADNNTSNTWIYSNSIGTNVGGNADLGNNLDGVLLGGGTFDNRIGGTGANERNLMAFNRRGIFADGGIRNSFSRNRVFSNDQLGIDLAPVGVTTNDAGDGDSGPNGLLNFPVITYVNAQNSSVTIEGTYSSAPNQSYTLEFFGNTAIDTTGYGEGRNFLGHTSVTTDGSGNASFNVSFSAIIANTGTWVTATATDASNNTSEYSLARNICADLRLTPAGFFAAASGGSGSFTVIQSAGCSYTPVPNVSWLTVTSSIGGTVSFSVAANSGAQRSGAIVVNYNNGQFFTGVNFNVTQLAFNCNYSLNPSSVNLSTVGGAASFGVITDAGCNWTAASNATWITITGGTSGTGSGTIFFSVSTNSGPPRTGTITVGGQSFTVNQAGCGYTLSRTSINLGAFENSFSFTVSPSSGSCTWTVASNDSWITVQGSANRLGNGTVVFTAGSAQGQARTGTISVAGQVFTVNQTPSCVYTFNPISQTHPASGGSGNIGVIAPAGCGWGVGSSVAWLTITSGSFGIGNGTINYSLAANPGNARGTQIYLDNANFDVIQQANCTFDTSASSISFLASGGNGSFDVTNAGTCSWMVMGSQNWITITSQTSNNGDQTVIFSIATNATGAPRSGNIQILWNGSSVRTVNISQAGGTSPFDFDGDSKTDVSIFRPGSGQWWYLRSVDGGNRAFTFGQSTDKLAPADFTGDGKTDIAFWRPSTGEWYVLRSEDSTFYAFPFGANGDVPVPADYDGDGKGDAAVFRPSTAIWYISRSSGGITIQNFGASTDIPIHGDFDGDAKSDLAIFRPSDGSWWIQRSSNGSTFATIFGASTDKRVPGDYTGDGKTDLAFWRPSTGQWFILRSENLSYYAVPFGISSDIPVAGDYDGDGRWDVSVFRPTNNTWYLNRSTSGVATVSFGAAGDKPVPSAWIP